MAKRILNRKELRADYDAAERRRTDDDEADELEEDTEDEEEEGQPAAETGDAEAAEVEAPKKARKKAPAKPRARSRAAKAARLRVVWGVFNNSNVCVATYEYPRRKDADEHAAKLAADKRTTFFVQPVKEPIAESSTS